MNINSLRDELKLYKVDDASICVYALLKNDESKPIKLDIEIDALNKLKGIFWNEVENEIIDNEELSLMKLSSSDERSNVIYEYDLDIPQELHALDFVLENDNIELLNLNQHDFLEIKALIIEIGNDERQIVLYKTMAAINVFSRKHFFIIKSEHRLKQIADDFLRITADFQLLKVNGVLLVTNLKALERNFGFHDIIKKEATLGCSAIRETSLLANPEVLEELIDDVKYARKLTKIAKHSPVLIAKISNQNIIAFCQKHKSLKGKFRFTEGNDQIILDTKVSKDLFIKVLMDDFLTSELTKNDYVSLAKDTLSNTTEDNNMLSVR
ncbi:anti-phage protein KwaB [Actinobacillus equuli]|uniref:anti-phage protein KwaB n=1 Tax=Actinobacillus equuli TaxID=718 RepID=UPI002442F655|nr:anti-phage protein KwaB [Actinobacillus equuli]WGE46932.1 DUF4868 domain-containing protein [Actinobacillus equuli subsp. haemolyticus]